MGSLIRNFSSFAYAIYMLKHRFITMRRHLPHDWGDSRITHAYAPKTAVLCRIGQKEKRCKSSDFQRFAVEARTS